jgi:hypothetical protein
MPDAEGNLSKCRTVAVNLFLLVLFSRMECGMYIYITGRAGCNVSVRKFLCNESHTHRLPKQQRLQLAQATRIMNEIILFLTYSHRSKDAVWPTVTKYCKSIMHTCVWNITKVCIFHYRVETGVRPLAYTCGYDTGY